MNKSKALILSLLISLLFASCATKRISEKVVVRDTIITPERIRLDTLLLFKDTTIKIVDSTEQITVTLTKYRDNFIKVSADCKPKQIVIQKTKTVTKTKERIVENLLYKRMFFLLLLIVGIYFVIRFK